ncbi:MAG: pimeloyl-ACP methyl ester carboxylesterase [Arenicella sp.]|jgi:pimeloyl-ACP methyl ester carboxylesterase
MLSYTPIIFIGTSSMRLPLSKFGLAAWTFLCCTFIATITVVLIAAKTSQAQELNSKSNSSLNFKRCQIKHKAVEIDAECATLTRPEDPNQANGKTIDLFVVKLPSSSSTPQADAFTVIQGGPGGSSIDLAIGLRQALDFVREKRDVLIVDQRGTGRSNSLQCDLPEQDQLATSFDREQTAKLTQACLSKLKDNNLRFYTTSVAVQDLDAVRQASGYEQLTIYGVSYGTRVAQHYLRRFPEYTRALIIDGVVDIGLNLAGAEIARRSQDAFDGMVKRCTETSSCFEQFGDIKQKFKQLRQRLITQPVELSIAHPLTGKEIHHTVSESDLLAAVRFMPYATESTALLPMIIASAHAGDYTPLAAQGINLTELLGDEFATGMHNSVMCTEDAPFVDPKAAEQTAETYFGSDMLEGIAAVCQVWPRGAIDADFRAAFDSEKPILILSGETDPVTPPANGARAAEMFSNSKHLVIPSHGHGVIGRGCVPFLIRDFVIDANLKDVKSDCIERERAMPFFIDTTGPTP